ncbi:MAG: helix-turn-helix domain-containing protein [Candidatus Levyibacteriota bacterium]|jgi:cytoskeletal protein RodZ
MIKSGEKLQQARIEKGLNLEDVAKATKIKSQFLSYIEEGNYQKLPSASYAYGFVRNYARYLGLSDQEILALFRREFDEDKAYRVLPKGLEERTEFPIVRFKAKQTIFLCAIAFILLAGYLLFQYRDAFLNPPLTISSPKNMSSITSSQVTVSGQTDPNATVYVEKNAVSVDENGNFQKVITVFPGITTITVRVVNRFSKETDKKIQIDVKTGT